MIACDIDGEQIHMARRNAEVYGVADRIEFRHEDFFKAVQTVHADAVFLSPPWGGPEYLSGRAFDCTALIPQFSRYAPLARH